MNYLHLGNSDLRVSRICLGCMGFGVAEAGMHKWTLDYKSSKQIISYALDQGVNFFDTAMAYQSGTSEEFVGKAIRELTDRDKVVLATKYTPAFKKEDAGRKYIESCLDKSLERMGMDYIDLYIMHSWDYNTPLLETLETLTDARKAGKIRAIGISNCYAWQLAKINALAKEKGLDQFVSIQSHYNLLAREDERELVKYCLEDNIAMTPYSSLASGRLSKRPGETSKRLELDQYAKGKYDATAEADGKIIERVAEVADRLGVSMTEVSLAWLLTKVTSPVVGATKPHHIDGAIKAVDLKLSEEDIAYLEELYVPHALVGVLGTSKWIPQAK